MNVHSTQCYAVIMRIRSLNHSIYQVSYHIVWGTKYRRKILKPYVQKELVKSFYKTLRTHPTWFLLQINTDSDHVHMRIEFPPTVDISTVVRELKSRSSTHLRLKFKFIDRLYKTSGMWSVGYFVSTIGLNENQIKNYITKQSKYDVGHDVTNEFS